LTHRNCLKDPTSAFRDNYLYIGSAGILAACEVPQFRDSSHSVWRDSHSARRRGDVANPIAAMASVNLLTDSGFGYANHRALLHNVMQQPG